MRIEKIGAMGRGINRNAMDLEDTDDVVARRSCTGCPGAMKIILKTQPFKDDRLSKLGGLGDCGEAVVGRTSKLLY